MSSITAGALATYFESNAYVVIESSPQPEAPKPAEASTTVCEQSSSGHKACVANLQESLTLRESLSGLLYRPRYAILGLSFHAIAEILHMVHIAGLALFTLASQVFVAWKLGSGSLSLNDRLRVRG